MLDQREGLHLGAGAGGGGHGDEGQKFAPRLVDAPVVLHPSTSGANEVAPLRDVDAAAAAESDQEFGVEVAECSTACFDVIGGRILVTGAVELALLAKVSERIIGLTIVAIGTSLPELVTSLVAARKGHAELAVANVIGSNIFNILGVLGVVAIIAPPIEVSPAMEYDMVWMLGFSLALFPMMWNRLVSRREGAVLLGGWLVYLFWLLR